MMSRTRTGLAVAAALLAALLATLLATLQSLACSAEEEEPSCDDVRQEGKADARESVLSCFECNYEQTWSGQEQPTDELKGCYADGWFYVYMYECYEVCYTPEEADDEGCCEEGMDYQDEQMEAMGL